MYLEMDQEHFNMDCNRLGRILIYYLDRLHINIFDVKKFCDFDY